MLRHLGELVRPGGTLLLTDFALPEGGPVARAITEIYYRPVNWIAWALGLCALHPILDYARLIEPMGFRIEPFARRSIRSCSWLFEGRRGRGRHFRFVQRPKFGCQLLDEVPICGKVDRRDRERLFEMNPC